MRAWEVAAAVVAANERAASALLAATAALAAAVVFFTASAAPLARSYTSCRRLHCVPLAQFPSRRRDQLFFSCYYLVLLIEFACPALSHLVVRVLKHFREVIRAIGLQRRTTCSTEIKTCSNLRCTTQC